MNARDDGYTIHYLSQQTTEELRRLGIMSPIEGEPSEDEATSYEQKFGVGAQDADTVDLTDITPWHEDVDLPWFEAGELYAMARRGATAMRNRAFRDRALMTEPDGPVIHAEAIWWEQRSTFGIERERGIPAWE